ncbi:hypothetical protein GCM10027291_35780 [Telluribacter humicola]
MAQVKYFTFFMAVVFVINDAKLALKKVPRWPRRGERTESGPEVPELAGEVTGIKKWLYGALRRI